MRTEVHVYAMAIAASILLAMVPFLIVMVSLCDHVLHWRVAANAIYFALNDTFPDDIGNFIVRNLRATVAQRPFQIVSLLLLLFTANGIFVPLEVALNRVWGCKENRTYLRNQLVSLGLIFLCGSLFLVSITFTAFNSGFVSQLSTLNQFLSHLVGVALFKIAAVPVLMLMLFFVYWLLPNRKVPVGLSIRAAIATGLVLELIQIFNIVTWPWLRRKMSLEYGPFAYSVTIVLYSFIAAMVVLAGADWMARRAAAQEAANDVASPS
jgi:membrane protein